MSQGTETRPTGRRVLRPFAGLVVANLVSTIGGAMSLVALPWFAFATTRSAFATGLAAFFEFAAVVVASLCTGRLIRAVGARGVRIWSDALSGVSVVVVPLLFHAGWLPFWAFLGLVAVNGFLRTPALAASYLLLSSTVTRAGMRTDAVVGPYLASLQFAGVIGAPLAGVAIGALGASTVLLLDAATFAFSALVLWATLPSEPVKRAPTVRASLRAAFGAVLRLPVLRLMLLASAVSNLFSSAWGSVIAPVYGSDVLHSATALGWVLAAQSLGSVGGAWVGGVLGRRFSLRWTVPPLMAAGMMPLFTALGSMAPLVVLLPASLVSGAAFGAFGTILVNVQYVSVPADQQGHVFGVVTALGPATHAVGPLLAGVIIGAWSLPVFCAIAVIVGVVLVGGMLSAGALRIDLAAIRAGGAPLTREE